MSVPTIDDLVKAHEEWLASAEETTRLQNQYVRLVKALARENNSQVFARPEDWESYAAAQKAERAADAESKIRQTATLNAPKNVTQASRERSCGHIQKWLDERKAKPL